MSRNRNGYLVRLEQLLVDLKLVAVGHMAGSKVGETIVKGAQKIRDGARKVITKLVKRLQM